MNDIIRIGIKDTAKLVRRYLKCKFPDVKFSVKRRSKQHPNQYSGSTCIDVIWTDGPDKKQVDGVVKNFEGSYLNGWVRKEKHQIFEGKQTRFDVDFITTNRQRSSLH